MRKMLSVSGGAVFVAILFVAVWQIPLPRIIEFVGIFGIPIAAMIFCWNKNRFFSYGILMGFLFIIVFILLLVLPSSSEMRLQLF